MDTLTVVLSIRLDPDLHRQLREAADRNYRSLNKQISLILDGWVEQYGDPGSPAGAGGVEGTREARP